MQTTPTPASSKSRAPKRRWVSPGVHRIDTKEAETGIDIGPELILLLS